MDSARFDRIARSIAAITTRRSALGLLSAVALGGALSLPDDASARKKKRKKKCKSTCGLCRKCKKGKCKPKRNGTDCGDCAKCQGGKCVSECQGGESCSGDVCAVAPTCGGRDVFCDATEDCCSGNCQDEDADGVLACVCSEPGQPCLLTGDCCEGACVGFVCTA